MTAGSRSRAADCLTETRSLMATSESFPPLARKTPASGGVNAMEAAGANGTKIRSESERYGALAPHLRPCAPDAARLGFSGGVPHDAERNHHAKGRVHPRGCRCRPLVEGEAGSRSPR